MNMRGQYLIMSPQSSENCFYHCLVYMKTILENKTLTRLVDNNYVVEAARDLKDQFGNLKDHSTLADIQDVANYYNCTFTIYDNLFHIIEGGEIKPTKEFRRKQGMRSTLIGAHIKL